MVVRAYEKVTTYYNLFIVGNAPCNFFYISELKKIKEQGMVFTGYLFGKEYRELPYELLAYAAISSGITLPAKVI